MKPRDIAATLQLSAYVTAVNAVTLVPLLGLFVGDRRPSVAAAAMVLTVACLLMVAAIVVHRLNTRRERKLTAAPKPFDVARARRETHALGLPYPEPDGTLSWPKPTSEQVHDGLHARRRAAQPVGPDPLCDHCDGAGVIVFARVADNGALIRIIQPCNACRK